MASIASARACDSGAVSDVFCQIAAGEADAAMVLQTDQVVAFLDRRPVFKGHVLVCPLPHATTLSDLPAEQIGPFFTTVQSIADAVVAGLGCQGTFVAMNNVVSQSVAHLHCHVVPRTKGDGLKGFFWPRTKYADDAEAQDYADRIAAALG